MNKICRTLRSALPLSVLLLSACLGGGGGGTTTAGSASSGYTIGGSVTGLSGSVVLQNNGGDDLTVNSSGNFTFASKVTDNSTYAVTVLTQPAGQTCSVSTGAGTVSGNNVSNVAVVCATNAYTVGGTVSGLTGSVVLQDNNGDDLTVTANGAFTFAMPVANGSPYSVTVLTQPTGKSCSVANGTGTISLANVGNVAITCAANTHTVGGTVSGLNGSIVLQNNSADNLAVSTNGPFNFPTAVTYGNPYSVTQLSQQFPNQDCTITNGSGTVTGNVANVAVSCVKYTTPRYAYTANQTDNSVSTYVVDAATGRLKFIGKVASGASPRSVTVDPSGKYAYVVNTGDGINPGTVSQYSIGANGTLTAMAAATVAAGVYPTSVTVDPSGKYVYVANDGDGINPGTVSQYSIGADGALTPMAAAAVAAGINPRSVTVELSGKYAYVANHGGGTVSQYSIGADGALTPMAAAAVAAGINPWSVTVAPSGKYAYVANGGDGINPGTVSQYSIGANGALTAMAVATVAAGVGPNSVTVDLSGKYAYVANEGGNSVSQYTIGADGALTAMAVATVAAGVWPDSVTVDPSGKYAYVANYSGTVSQYGIGATGALTPLSTATVADMVGSVSIAVSAGAVPARAVAKYAYVANQGSNSVSQYTIGADGALTAMAVATVAAGLKPQSVTVDPSGKYAYVANIGNVITPGTTVSQYTIGADGALTPMAAATVAAGVSPASVTVDPAGKYAYVANAGDGISPGTVSQYSIGVDGALTAMTVATVAAGINPQSVTVDPSGKYAYVANYNDNTISQYSIGADGALTAMTTATVAAGAGPNSVTVDPSGKYAYVANSGSANVSQYTIGADGALTVMAAATVAAGGGPNSVAVDPSGKYAYVANSGSNNVSQYTIGTDGSLTAMAAVAAGFSPLSLTVDPSGKYVYAANYTDHTVSQYSIGANGALTPMATTSVAMGTTPYPFFIVTTGTWQ